MKWRRVPKTMRIIPEWRAYRRIVQTQCARKGGELMVRVTENMRSITDWCLADD